MAASQPGPRYNGLWRNPVSGGVDFYVDGTVVDKRTSTTLEIDAILDVDGVANFAAEAEFEANVHLKHTIEVGADGVGADGEQLTSGGAGAAGDWATA